MEDELRWRWECPSCKMCQDLEDATCIRCGNQSPAVHGKEGKFRRTVQIHGTTSIEMWKCNACSICNPASSRLRCQWCWTTRPIFRELEFFSSDLSDFSSNVVVCKNENKNIDRQSQTDEISNFAKPNYGFTASGAISNEGIDKTSSERGFQQSKGGTKIVLDTEPESKPNVNVPEQTNGIQNHFSFEWRPRHETASQSLTRESDNPSLNPLSVNLSVVQSTLQQNVAPEILKSTCHTQATHNDSMSSVHLQDRSERISHTEQFYQIGISETEQNSLPVEELVRNQNPEPNQKTVDDDIASQEYTIITEQTDLETNEVTDTGNDKESSQSVVIVDDIEPDIEKINDKQSQEQAVTHQHGGLLIQEVSDEEAENISGGTPETFSSDPVQVTPMNQESDHCSDLSQSLGNNVIEMDEEMEESVQTNTLANNMVTPPFGTFEAAVPAQNYISVLQSQTCTTPSNQPFHRLPQLTVPMFASNSQVFCQNSGSGTPFSQNPTSCYSLQSQQYNEMQMQTQMQIQQSSQSQFPSVFQSPNYSNQSSSRVMAIGHDNNITLNLPSGSDTGNLRLGIYGNNNTVTINQPPQSIAATAQMNSLGDIQRPARHMEGRKILYANRRLNR